MGCRQDCNGNKSTSKYPRPVSKFQQDDICRAYPNITAFQSKMLLSWGAPLIPAGGSCCNRLKSLISLFLAGVDILTRLKDKRRENGL
ncbi:unnamed protein product [Spirodela intermedia]|uniref:Uncharacterized protein n=1 Tax=Spirodela intermedia TaxID=51605 RepID=A0A7I8LL23_SPIIN|nr:unnamed protein product [Spirodela intermedia]